MTISPGFLYEPKGFIVWNLRRTSDELGVCQRRNSSLKVLVTGGSGPLGLAVAQELKEEHQLYLLDTEPIETEFESIQCNILQMDEIQPAVRGMDAIIHLAEAPHDVAIDAEEREQQELDFATRGTYYLMRAAVSEGVQRVIYKSSLAIFDSLESHDKADKP